MFKIYHIALLRCVWGQYNTTGFNVSTVFNTTTNTTVTTNTTNTTVTLIPSPSSPPKKCAIQLALSNKINQCKTCVSSGMHDCNCCKVQTYISQFDADINNCPISTGGCNNQQVILQKCKMTCDKITSNGCDPYATAISSNIRKINELNDCYNGCFTAEYNCPENSNSVENKIHMDYVGIALGCAAIVGFCLCFFFGCPCQDCQGIERRSGKVSSFNDV
jgi:hypothetical protein